MVPPNKGLFADPLDSPSPVGDSVTTSTRDECHLQVELPCVLGNFLITKAQHLTQPK